MTVTTLQKPVGKVVGAILLIAGTSIGAAMLALPVSTGRAGLLPSILVMIASWAYLLYAAFCMLEVQLAMPKESNLMTMAEKTLGWGGKLLSGGCYLFLLYALNTAYLSGITALFQDISKEFFSITLSKVQAVLPVLLLFTLFFSSKKDGVDIFNRTCMIGLLISFTALLFIAAPLLSFEMTHYTNWEYVIPSLSILLCAFGYHIIIPSLVSYLDRDVPSIKKSIIIGSSIPLVGYITWQVFSLLMIDEPSILFSAYQEGINSAQMLAKAAKNSVVFILDHAISFFVMVTSFVGVLLSLFDFLKDGLKRKKFFLTRPVLFILALVPPLYFALFNDRVFLLALEVAGGYGVVILLALIPALMLWQKRYVLKIESVKIAPQSKALHIVFIAITISIILVQIIV